MTRRKKTSESYSRQVETSIHTDERFCALSRPQPCAQWLWMYLLTAPITTQLPGVLRTGKAGLAENLGWEVDELLERFAELEDLGMAVADWNARLVFLPNGIKVATRQGLGADWVGSFKPAFGAVPECALKVQIWERFNAVIGQLASEKPITHTKTYEAFRLAMPRPDWTPAVRRSGQRPALRIQAEPVAEQPLIAGTSDDPHPPPHPGGHPPPHPGAPPWGGQGEGEGEVVGGVFAGAEPDAVPDEPPPPPPEKNADLAWFEDAQAARTARHGKHPEKVPPSLQDDLATARTELGEGNFWRLGAAWLRYLEYSWAINRDPVCPWAGFRRLWRNHLPPMGAAVRERHAKACELPGCSAPAKDVAWTDRPGGFGHHVCPAHMDAWGEYPIANTADVPSEAEWQAFCATAGAGANVVRCDVSDCRRRADGVFRFADETQEDLAVCEWHGAVWETPLEGGFAPRPSLGSFQPHAARPESIAPARLVATGVRQTA